MSDYRSTNSGHGQRRTSQPQTARPKKPAPALTEDNYADIAEAAIKTLKEQKDSKNRPLGMLTTSQIRNLLAMTADIYNEVASSSSEKLDKAAIERINYLRIRFVYEAGRDNKVKSFVEESHVLEYLKKASGSRTEYIRFSRYMEALVAYHRYYSLEDQ